MHGNQWVLKIAVLKYYSVSKRRTTAKSNPKQATDPISLHTKFGDNSSNTFPLKERKPCVTPDIGRRTSDGGKSKNNISTPQGGGHNSLSLSAGSVGLSCQKHPGPSIQELKKDVCPSEKLSAQIFLPFLQLLELFS